MKHIHTTATMINKIKSAAKQIKKSENILLAEGLDLAARAAGYDDFHHVTVCADRSKRPDGKKLLGQLDFYLADDLYELQLYDGDGNPKGMSKRMYGEFIMKRSVRSLERAEEELADFLDEHDGGFGSLESMPKGSLEALIVLTEQLVEKEPGFLDGFAHWIGALNALRRYEDAVRIGEPVFAAAGALLPAGYKGFIPYSMLSNRPYHRLAANLRLGYHGVGKHKEGQAIARQMLKWWPNDNMGFRFLLGPLRT